MPPINPSAPGAPPASAQPPLLPPLVPPSVLHPPVPPLPPPPPLAPPAPAGASDALVKLQYTILHVAPCALHLQSASVVHQPSLPLDPVPAGAQTCGVTPKLQTSPPHWGVATQSMSFMQVAGFAANTRPDSSTQNPAINQPSFLPDELIRASSEWD